MADEWHTTREEQATDAKREKTSKSRDKKMILDGQLFELVPEDLLKASNKDHVLVRYVKVNSGSRARLDTPTQIRFGALHVTREERDRFAKQMGFALDKSKGGILLEPIPPYLDENYPNFMAV